MFKPKDQCHKMNFEQEDQFLFGESISEHQFQLKFYVLCYATTTFATQALTTYTH